MSSQQLWAPKAQSPAVNSVRTNLVPGTWLQLSPTASPACETNKFLPLSPTSSALPSPALNAESGASAAEELSLAGPSKFLTNSTSRTSSFSSTSSSGFRHPSLGQKTNFGPSIERREMSIHRVGGVGGAFLSNH